MTIEQQEYSSRVTRKISWGNFLELYNQTMRLFYPSGFGWQWEPTFVLVFKGVIAFCFYSGASSILASWLEYPSNGLTSRLANVHKENPPLLRWIKSRLSRDDGSGFTFCYVVWLESVVNIRARVVSNGNWANIYATVAVALRSSDVLLQLYGRGCGVILVSPYVSLDISCRPSIVCSSILKERAAGLVCLTVRLKSKRTWFRMLFSVWLARKFSFLSFFIW